MRYLHRRVEINGYEGEVTSYNNKTLEYDVKFDKGHPFRMDTWQFSENTIELSLKSPRLNEIKSERNYTHQKKCQCGALKLLDCSPHSHATWCDMYKGGY